jgi:putative copper resistance protein D
VTELGLLARFFHLAASVVIVGSAGLLLLAGHSDRPTALRWQARVSALSRALVLLALVTGVTTLAQQAATLEQRTAAALEPAALARVALETQAGVVWTVRHGVLLLLGAFLAARADLSRRLDWRAARAESLLLGAAALGLLAAAGHAAAVEPDTTAAVGADLLHLLGAGLWVGALPGLALLLGMASREPGADARPYAVVTARRFSRAALLLVFLLAFTGVATTVSQVGSVAALLGTRYGQLLLLKLALFLPLMAIAALNRRLLPRLSGEAASLGRPAMRRLRRFVLVESGLGAAILAVVAVLAVTAPARHEQPVWPLSFRLAWTGVGDTPEVWPFVLIGTQVAVLGVVALIASRVLRAARLPALLGGAVLLMAGLAIAVPPLATDAYPTTYQRPAVSYQAGSIVAGAMLYREHCAACHGPRGAGDGPAGAGLSPPPADLLAHHATLHTAGDLYWWITHGRRQMPAFGDRLDVEQRWDLVNYIRALAAADTARTLRPGIEPDRPRIVAPDFVFAVGPAAPRALKEYRGQRIVLVVLYTLPGSRPRLAELATRYPVLLPLGVEIVAVPTDAAPDAIGRLGAEPRILFPVVTEGAREIAVTYQLFHGAAHAEFLVDRQGYLRAIDGMPATSNVLLANVEALNLEKVTAPPPAEHVH